MDRDEVIKALEHCKDNQHVYDCDKCDYGGKTGMFCIRMIDDTIAMLKEQEESIPVSWLKEKLEGHPELSYAVTDGINNVLDLWEGR